MGKLEKELPKIVQTNLKEEDDVTRALVKFLLSQVVINEGKSAKETIIKKALDDEIRKYIETDLISQLEKI